MPEYENLSASERYMKPLMSQSDILKRVQDAQDAYISHLLTGSRIQAYYSWYLLVLVSNILDFFFTFAYYYYYYYYYYYCGIYIVLYLITMQFFLSCLFLSLINLLF